tara:strand:+ start:18 stop:494 length:477 start_codon:yes stop_codon:yes gene_type:complete
VGFYSGRDGELHIGSTILNATKAAKVQSWSFSSSMAVLETTSLGDTDRTLKAGVRSYSGSCRLFYYVAAPASGANSNLHDILTTAIKTGGGASDGENDASSSIILKLRLTTGSTDIRDLQFAVFITGVSMNSAVGEVASADISWEADGAPFGATSLID